MVFIEVLTAVGISGAIATTIELVAIGLVVYKLVDGAKAITGTK